MQGFVRNQGDAWTWTLDQLKRAVDDLATPARRTHESPTTLADYARLRRRIGRRLGEMHRGAGRADRRPGLRARVRPTARRCRRAGSSARDGCSSQAFDIAGAARRRGTTSRRSRGRSGCSSQRDGADRARCDRLAAGGRRALDDPHPWRLPSRPGAGRQGDAYIIDFEGEPARPLAERRAKTSPLRDVAGLLRSLDYAAAATLDPKNVDRARRVPEERARRSSTRLRDGAQARFPRRLSRGGGRLAAAWNDATLLDFFLLEKAAYEIGYEAANRPTWLAIPLAGLAPARGAHSRADQEHVMNDAHDAVRCRRSIAAIAEALAHGAHGDPFARARAA